MTSKPFVSVIIPTFNSENSIERCLQSLLAQTYSYFEIIVVDKSSVDRTVDIVKKYQKVRLFIIDALERSDQFNFGVSQSRGKYIYEVGSDFIVESKVIEEAVRKCEEEKFHAICIHNTSDSSVSFWARIRKFERDMYKDDDLNVAARFIRKDIFESIGGFDENLVAAEDYDLHNRLISTGCRIGKINAKEIHIGEPKTIGDIVRKHFYYGRSIGNFISKNPKRGIYQLSPIRPAFARHWRDFILNPRLTAGFIIYQVIRYYSSALGYIYQRIAK